MLDRTLVLFVAVWAGAPFLLKSATQYQDQSIIMQFAVFYCMFFPLVVTLLGVASLYRAMGWKGTDGFGKAMLFFAAYTGLIYASTVIVDKVVVEVYR
jgi:hypothetical protein